MSWLTSLHSARRRLPDSVIMKELVSQRQLRSGYTIRLQQYKNLLRKDKNGRKYQCCNTNLRLFKPNRLNISEILYKQMLFFITLISKRRTICVEIIYIVLRKSSSKQTHNKFACHFVNRTIKDQFGPSFLVVL